MKDDAVSPVVAFMLLLMVIVSFISVLNAYYIPSLKQQAEIEHLKMVEEGMLSIESDVNRLLSFRENATLKERMPLGGGDVMFSPVRSSGTLRVSLDKELGKLAIHCQSGTAYEFPFTTARISYQPIDNFWIKQGYTWSNGIVTVTKGTKNTWLEFTDENNATRSSYDFFSLITTVRVTEFPLSTGILDNATISVSNISIEEGKTFVSNNGNDGVNLEMRENTGQFNDVDMISLSVNSSLTAGERNYINSLFNNVNFTFFNHDNCHKLGGFSSGNYIFDFTLQPVDITLKKSILTMKTA